MKQFIDKDKLKKICNVVKLEISGDEIEKYLDMINNNLESLERLDAIDTDGLEALSNPYQMTLHEYPDLVSDGDKVKDLMSIASTSLYNYYVVPKVIEK
jgi:aspartyl-tRNA(Asn)/glutamyl-tRNA(Gln) amidotransferase subunit C